MPRIKWLEQVRFALSLRRNKTRSRRRHRLHGVTPIPGIIEILEDRTLLAANLIAQFEGVVSEPGVESVVTVNLTADDFTIGSGHTTLGFVVQPADGSEFVPLPIDVESLAPGNVPTILQTRLDDGSSLVLAKFKHGTFEIQIAGVAGSTGAWEMQVFLAGDVNGDFVVDETDRMLANDLKQGNIVDPILFANADVNRDGRITGFDLARSAENTGNSTTIRPLSITVGLDPASETGVFGDNIVNQTPVDVVGLTQERASIALDVDGDGFDDGQTTGGPITGSTNYTFTAGLSEGPNTISVEARESFGQVATASTVITLDTVRPNVTITSPTDGLLTNSNVTVSGQATDDGSGVFSVEAKLDDGEFVSVSLDASGNYSFDTSLSLDNSADGPHTVTVRSTDVAGNVSGLENVSFTLDTVSPTIVSTSPTAGAVVDGSQGDLPVEIVFSEAMVGASVLSALSVTGNTTGAITPLNPGYDEVTNTLTFALSELLSDTSFTVTVANTATDLAGNVPSGGPFAFSFTVNREAPVVAITEISPANGEALVSTTRNVIVRFSGQVDPATITAASLKVIANGSNVPGRIMVSSTERFATFFPVEPWPGSTEIRVVVDGNLIVGRSGEPLDANGDSNPGGVATADFRTVPISRLQGTNVTGRVIASERGPNGEDMPLGGVTIRVDGYNDFFAVTDVDGNFILENTPAPVFFVHIDGSTTTTVGGQPIPETGFYPTVGKPFHSVPGQTVELNHHGHPFDIHLPFIPNATIHQVTTGESITVTLPPEQIADDPSLAFVSLTVPADSLINADGTPGTHVGIYRVNSDRLPAPLPFNLNHAFDITVQADAPIFDTPAPITFPNLDGLAPGEKTLLMSFDHPSGEWVVVGTMTVSSDGLTVVSDPGVGVRAPGWHGAQQGTQTSDCLDEALTIRNFFDVLQAVKTCVSAKLKGEARQLLELIGFFVDNAIDLADSIQQLTSQVASGQSGAALQTTFNLLKSHKNSLVTLVTELVGKKNTVLFGIDFAIECGESVLSNLSEICDRILSSGKCNSLTVDTVCIGIDGASLVLTNLKAIRDTLQNSLNENLVVLVCNALDAIEPLIFGSSPIVIPNSLGSSTLSSASSSDEILSLLDDAERELASASSIVAEHSEFTSLFQHWSERLEELLNDGQAMFEMHAAPLNGFYLLQAGDLILRGRVSSGDNISGVLPANTNFDLILYDVETNRIAIHSGTTQNSGIPTFIPLLEFGSSLDLEDSDGDGLPDLGERAIGTDLNGPDTDGDGIDDATEIEQGLDPLDNRGFPTGVVATLPVFGQAKEVIIEGSTLDAEEQIAYVATGSYGLAIVDASQFNLPIVLGQIDLPGDATDVAVDSRLGIAVVATGNGGLHFVDVSDPMLPLLQQTVNVSANQVEIVDGVAYVGIGAELRAYDVLTGQLLDSLVLGTGSVTGLGREGLMLYTMQSTRTLRAIDISGFGMLLRGFVTPPDGGGKLFVGGGIAYAAAANNSRGGFATVNVSDPDNLILLSGSDVPSQFVAPRQAIVSNGSELGLLLGTTPFGGVHALDLMDLSDPANTNQFLTRITLPSSPSSLAVGAGLAFVAGGSSGLHVVNYLPFDNQGQAPTINISAATADLDPNTPGVQVLEGTTVPITTNITDDVQVRNVELIVNGQVVRNDVSFPFDLTAIALPISANDPRTTIQVRATDTGGNETLSNEIILELVPDTFAPTVIASTPADGGLLLKTAPSVRIRFDESLDVDSVSASDFTLTDANGATITPTNLQLRSDDREVQVTFAGLAPGAYTLTVSAGAIADRAGNLLETDFTRSFTVTEATTRWIGGSGFWDDGSNWVKGRVPTAEDFVLLDLPFGVTVTQRTGSTTLRGLILNGSLVIQNSTFSVPEINVDGSITLINGTLNDTYVVGTAGSVVTVTSSGATLDGVRLDSDLTVQTDGDVRVLNGLVLNGTAQVFGGNRRITGLDFSGTQTLSGTGTVVLTRSSFSISSERTWLRGTDGGTLTIGSGITVRGGGFNVQVGDAPTDAIINQGTIVADLPGQTLFVAGILTNQGTLRAENSGILTVSNLTMNGGTLDANVGGHISILGDLVLGSTDTIRVELGGTSTSQYGRITVSGTVTLAGTLDIVLVGNFESAVGDTFEILTFGSRIGTFDTILGTNLDNGNLLTLQFELTRLLLVTV